MPGALKVKVGGTYVNVARGPKGEPGAAVVPEKAGTDLPSAYPTGLSLFAVTASTKASWPLGSEGLAITHVADGQGFQVFHAREGTHYTRTLDGTVWTPWFAPGNVFRVRYDAGAGAYPARPPGATYVEWIGPVAPPSGVRASGDTFISTEG